MDVARRLAFLTVIPVVFLPLALIAGIHGMNFENMPLLDLPFECPLAMGFIALFAASTIRLFLKKGWFK